MSTATSSQSQKEKDRRPTFKGGRQSYRQWMQALERQIGSEDPRLWKVIQRTIDLPTQIDRHTLLDYVNAIGEDEIYWEQMPDGIAQKEAQYRFTRILNLVTKLYYRLQEALEGEAQAYIDTQTTNNNGCEILRLLKGRYKIENQYT